MSGKKIIRGLYEALAHAKGEGEDVETVMLAEIERLRAENATLRAAVGNALERAEQAEAEMARLFETRTANMAFAKEAAARSMRERAARDVNGLIYQSAFPACEKTVRAAIARIDALPLVVEQKRIDS